MTCRATHTNLSAARAVCELGLKNQHLIGRSLDCGLLHEVKQLQRIDSHLCVLLLHHKMLGQSTHYVWRTQDDGKVRTSHAANDDKIFAWDKPPTTGHPGEDFNCRCWAEPLGDDKYARQLLITAVNDNPDKWTNVDFVRRYVNDIGGMVTLEETGYLGEVIEHYSETLGIYDRVNRQVMDEAMAKGEGDFTYSFEDTYDFGRIFSGIKYSFGDATVSGLFDGDVRQEQGFLVILGIITYNFYDPFTDPTSKVERLMLARGINREEAEVILGDSVDAFGTLYEIKGHWQTKFNATVKMGN